MEVSPGIHLLQDPVSQVRHFASLQQLPFRKTKMLGELCYTSQNSVPEGITVEIEPFTSHHFFPDDETWNCMKGTVFSCTCSYSLRPFDLHDSPRDIRFRSAGEQQIYKVRSFHVETFVATNFSNKRLLRPNVSRSRDDENDVSSTLRVELKPRPPVGHFPPGISEFETYYNYTDLQFPTKPGSGRYYHRGHRYRVLLMLMADFGGQVIIPVATRESESLRVLETDN